MKFLYAAFAVTWIVHIVYLVILTAGFARLHEDVNDLERD